MSNKVALDLLKSSGRIVIGSFQNWPHNLYPQSVPLLMVPGAMHIVCTSLGFQARNLALLFVLLPLPHLGLLIKSCGFHLGFQTWVHIVLPPSGVSLSSQSTTALIQTLPMSWTEQQAPNTPSCLVCPQCSTFSFGHMSDLKNELDHVTPLCKDFLLLPWLQNNVCTLQHGSYGFSYLVQTWPPSLSLCHSSHGLNILPWDLQTALQARDPLSEHCTSPCGFLGLEFFSLLLCVANAWWLLRF